MQADEEVCRQSDDQKKSTKTLRRLSMQEIYVDQDGIKGSLQGKTMTEENGAYIQ